MLSKRAFMCVPSSRAGGVAGFYSLEHADATPFPAVLGPLRLDRETVAVQFEGPLLVFPDVHIDEIALGVMDHYAADRIDTIRAEVRGVCIEKCDFLRRRDLLFIAGRDLWM